MPRILFLTAYPVEDASCRYRIHQFIPYLNAAGYECTIATFATDRLFHALRRRGRLAVKATETLFCGVRRLLRLKDLSDFDFIVIHREAFPFCAPMVENWILRRHKNVIFSFDDAIYAGHENSELLAHPILYRWKHGRGYDEVIRQSRAVIAGNRILGGYARRLNPRVTVIPTVVDCEQNQYLPSFERKPVTIGWIGSRSTVPYLELIQPALQRLSLSHHGQVQFRFVGCAQYKIDLPQCESVPFSLTRELDDLRTFDIGLMPLPDSEWARGKCAFKAIQYMASGIATVASPVGVTTDLIRHEFNGMLANSPDEWFCALERLLQDDILRRRITENARRTIEDSYSLQLWGPRLVGLFDQLRATPHALRTTAIAA